MRSLNKKSYAQVSMYVVLLLCVVALMMSLRYCSTPPSGSEKSIKASQGDTIDVAISYSPMTLYRYSDTLGGFSYDMLREIARRDGFVFKFHPVTSSSAALQGLQQGLYDMLVSDMARTSEMEGQFAFTSAVYLDRQVLVQRPDSFGRPTVTSQLELAGRTVWVEEGSPAFWRLKHLSAEIGDTIFIKADSRYTSEQLVLMVSVGDIPMTVVNESVARSLTADSSLNLSTSISFTQFQAWMLRSAGDSTLLLRINAAIDSLKSTPFYDYLSDRYGISVSDN